VFEQGRHGTPPPHSDVVLQRGPEAQRAQPSLCYLKDSQIHVSPLQSRRHPTPHNVSKALASTHLTTTASASEPCCLSLPGNRLAGERNSPDVELHIVIEGNWPR
jgi:hypothetical protein